MPAKRWNIPNKKKPNKLLVILAVLVGLIILAIVVGAVFYLVRWIVEKVRR